jgi:Protein of unknown function (DUF732).
MSVKKILMTLAATALAAVGVIQAAPAKADEGAELAYLQLLNMRGITVYDTVSALITGYRACGMLNYATGDVVIPSMTSIYPTMTLSEAERVVVSAVEALCPWHDHRGEGQPWLA